MAVKTLREDNQVSEDFKKEMAIMKRLRHAHLLSLIGVCSLEKPYYLVTEYMSEGCLLEFIRNVNPLHVNHLVQLQLVIQGTVLNASFKSYLWAYRRGAYNTSKVGYYNTHYSLN